MEAVASMKWQSCSVISWRRQVVPVFVWLAAAGAVGWLLVHRSSMCELAGIAHPEQREVAALTNGRLRLVPVELLESVKEGQPLAVLEDDRIQASLATAAAEAPRLRSELVAAENRLTADAAVEEAEYMADVRRYAVDVERLRLQDVELQVEIETDRIKLEFLRIQKDLLGNLRGQRAVSELRFKSAETECRALEQRIVENQKVLTEVRQNLEQARQRQESFARNHIVPRSLDKALEPLRGAVTVQERRIGELSLERSMLVLKSPMDGVVSQLLRGVGESVRAGEPILTVVSMRPSAVIAYASSAQAAQFATGSPVRLEMAREGIVMQTVDTQVQAVGPTIEQIPARLWRNPTVPEWGWPVKIVLPRELKVLCGEVIGVSRSRAGKGADSVGTPPRHAM